jgi:N-acetylglucosamine-6-sulfatase
MSFPTDRRRPTRRDVLRGAALGAAGFAGAVSADAAEAQTPATLPALEPIPGAKPVNIVFILADDHRYDALGCMGHPFLETPHLDSLAKNGVHAKNAFVTTALCSPSRASILTGRYAHRHRVVDNNNPVPPGTVYFPQYLQRAGYDTAFIGKWHMGGASDDPQPGFDHWVSFRGQGQYAPSPAGLNVNGKRTTRKGYITDELTDYAVEWLEQRPKEKPFFLYLSHKAVHAEFLPAERHRGRYAGKSVPVPKTFDPNTDPEGRPRWVKDQRNSHHGVDYPYHGTLDIAEYHRRYCETLLAVDESVGRVLETLRKTGRYENTLVVYMGDNGFAFGEHGLIDKRTAYEESMRVPLLMQCPALLPAGKPLDAVVANIDIAPTLLTAAGLKAAPHPQPLSPDGGERGAAIPFFDGSNFLPLAQGKTAPWRDALLYEYYWERNFPQTPTLFAVRTSRYKYIRYQGIWDTDELYDLQTDPLESKNLVRDPAHTDTVRTLNRQLWTELARTDGMSVPLLADNPPGPNTALRRPDGSRAADYPAAIYRKPPPR